MEKIIEERLRDYALVNKKTWKALNNGKITIFEAQYTRKKKVIRAIATDIKSKLKLIAEGKITKECGDLDIFFIDGEQINMKFKKYEGKKIRIWIEEVNNDN
jgi:hypothetical protein